MPKGIRAAIEAHQNELPVLEVERHDYTNKKRFAKARNGYPASAHHRGLESRMADGFVHTVHSNGHWTNTVEGDDQSSLDAFDTKDEALEVGRAEARRRQTEHVIHKQDGAIAERNSYGNDTANRPG